MVIVQQLGTLVMNLGKLMFPRTGKVVDAVLQGVCAGRPPAAASPSAAKRCRTPSPAPTTIVLLEEDLYCMNE